jgi:hypothetical protein
VAVQQGDLTKRSQVQKFPGEMGIALHYREFHWAPNSGISASLQQAWFRVNGLAILFFYEILIVVKRVL